MPSGGDGAGARVLGILKFWATVGVICALVGIVGFVIGRNYVGAHLHRMEVESRAPEIRPQTSQAPLPETEDAADSPPIEPVITLGEREPTSREQRRALRELTEPQDGAQLHATRTPQGREDREASADEADSDDEDSTAEAAPERRESYVVTAGAFADRTNAERQMERLSERGHDTNLISAESDGITYNRVQVGAFDSRAEADALVEQLKLQGFDATVGTGQE